jgi:periplasmic divalent cation tolerance protein
MEEAIMITTTAGEKAVLENVGRILLARRLVACFQIVGPIRSMYWWKGKMEEVDEWLGLMKTRAALYDDVERVVKAEHPYEVPQVVALKLERLGPSYHRWILEETGAPC